MELPDNIMSVVPQKPRHKFNIKVKTFVFTLDQIESDRLDVDGIVNDFCERHNIISLICDKHGRKYIYRITYKEMIFNNTTKDKRKNDRARE